MEKGQRNDNVVGAIIAPLGRTHHGPHTNVSIVDVVSMQEERVVDGGWMDGWMDGWGMAVATSKATKQTTIKGLSCKWDKEVRDERRGSTEAPYPA